MSVPADPTIPTTPTRWPQAGFGVEIELADGAFRNATAVAYRDEPKSPEEHEIYKTAKPKFKGTAMQVFKFNEKDKKENMFQMSRNDEWAFTAEDLSDAAFAGFKIEYIVNGLVMKIDVDKSDGSNDGRAAIGRVGREITKFMVIPPRLDRHTSP